MSSHWWRAYDEAVDDPKLLLLSDRAHRAWFNLMCLASIGGGRLPERKVIELKLRLSASKTKAVLDELIEAGLLDQDDVGLAPHNWNGRQYKSDVSTERVKRFREQQRNVSETPPENRIQKPETESSSLRSEDARARPNEAFDEFWSLYPNKVGKQAALKAFVSIMKSNAVTLDRLLFGLTAYVNKTDDRPWCNPATWLNQGRWDDQPAEVIPHDRRNSVIAAADKLKQTIAAFERGDEAELLSDVRGGSCPADVRLLSAK